MTYERESESERKTERERARGRLGRRDENPKHFHFFLANRFFDAAIFFCILQLVCIYDFISFGGFVSLWIPLYRWYSNHFSLMCCTKLYWFCCVCCFILFCSSSKSIAFYWFNQFVCVVLVKEIIEYLLRSACDVRALCFRSMSFTFNHQFRLYEIYWECFFRRFAF